MKVSLDSNNVVLDILVNGKPVKQYTHEGKIFIEAKDGTEYGISVFNPNYARIECVVGVDGVDVISGDPCNDNSTGYVINGRDTLKLKGYRISDEQEVSFKFAKAGESYASSKTVNAQNGVITVTCYLEYVAPPLTPSSPLTPNEWNPYKGTVTPNTPYWGITSDSFTQCDGGILRSMNATYACNVNSPGCSTTTTDSSNYSGDLKPSNHFSMGTTFGSVKDSKVVTVSFSRGICLGEKNLYYTTRENLKEIGVNLGAEHKVVFPVGKQKYCTPPPGWKA
jgi:hypothetical protein